MLKHRILTAALLIPLVLWGILALPLYGFGIISGLIILAGAWEWSRLAGHTDLRSRIFYLIIILLLIVISSILPIPFVLGIGVVGWFYAMYKLIAYTKMPKVDSKWSRALHGIWVLIPCWIGLNTLRSGAYGVSDILFLLVIIWGADTSAYFVGRKWGKRKLAPTLSPGKTWEGLYGALVTTAILAIGGSIVLHFAPGDWFYLTLICEFTVLSSIVGDLFESMLKRQAGVKDSGTILPGHGGILDRIDSLTAAATIFAFSSLLFGFN